MNDQIEKLLDSIDVNPKIRELAEQSGCSIDKLGFGEGNLEKFAELIIRESARVMDDADSEGRLDGDYAMYYLGEHFGVEE